jgi:tetratricopeptide (TPR) repeat protein
MASLRLRRSLFAITASILCCDAPHSIAAPPETTVSLADRIKQIQASPKGADGSQDNAGLPQNPVYKKMLPGVVFIGVTNAEGDSWQGTGWVLDREQRLVVTNQHVIEGVEECSVFFPMFEEGRLITSLAQSLIPSRAIAGHVIDSDQSSDLALIQLERLPLECVALPLADRSASPGQRVHSIAGNTVGSQSLWTYSTGYVRQILSGELANGGGCVMMESDMATNQGNSGGPVCDDEGRVVAVVEGHSSEARLVSLYIDLQALTAYLEEALRCVAPTTAEDMRFALKRHLDGERYNTALKLANAAIKLEPTSADNLALRGQSWLALDDEKAAKGDFTDALVIDKQCAAAHAGLGAVASINDDYEAAVKHYTDAIRNDSSNADYLISRGYVQLGNDEYQAALQDFNAAMKKDPALIDAARGKAFAQIYLEQYEAGGMALLELIDQFDDDAETFYMIGLALNGLEHRDQAMPYLLKALELDSEWTAAHYELGENLILAEQFAQAVEHLSIAVSEWDDDARTNYLYGVALFGAGDFKAAKSYFKVALKLDADDEEISTGVAELLQALKDAS